MDITKETKLKDILKRDFKENQIIIASIYEYDFDVVKKIEIKDRLINEARGAKE